MLFSCLAGLKHVRNWLPTLHSRLSAVKMVLISIIFVLLHEILTVPIIFDTRKLQTGNRLDGQCTLTEKLGRGKSEFLEECHTLGELSV